MITLQKALYSASLALLKNMHDSAKALLDYIDEHPHRLTADTFGDDAEQARKLIENLRAALSEMEY